MKKTLEQAIKYAKQYQHNAIMEKDGEYLSAKNMEEIEYAKSCGWNYVGHPLDLQ